MSLPQDSVPNAPVTMVRQNLLAIPQHPLPDGCSIRWYQPGDDSTWLKVYSAGEQFLTIGPELHAREFGTDLELLALRQAFLIDKDGEPIGTATAWLDDNYNGMKWGRIHWVAIVPDKQGKGRGKALMSAVCNRMIELGHERAYLATSTGRIAAINMYLKFGFRPEIRHAEDEAAWKAIAGFLSYPLLV